MKKRVLALIFVLVCILSGCSTGAKKTATVKGEFIENGFTENNLESTEMTVVAENDYLILRLNYDTTDFEVEVKSTGYVWRSFSTSESGTTARLLEFNYIDSSGNVVKMSTLNDSLKKGQYKIELIDNGVHITYSFGDIVKDLIYPLYIDAAKFDKLVEGMSARDRGIVKSAYIHLKKGLYDDELYANHLKKYPNAKGRDAYALRSTDMLVAARKSLSEAFANAGYTKKEYEKDCKTFAVDAKTASLNNPQFNIGINYVLDGDKLKVECPNEEFYWSGDINGIQSLDLLPFFASAELNETGYALLPDGSGSIVPLYNGTEDAGKIMSVAMYGDNLSITKSEKIYNFDQAILPVYGMKVENNAVFAIIETGEAIADINVIPGTDTLSARIWPDFNIIDTQQVYAKSLTASSYYTKAGYYMEQAEAFNGNIAVTYKFLTNEQADYSGMAAYCSDYYFGDRKTNQDKVPFYLDMISAIDYEETVSGFTNEVVSTLTTFEQAGKISDELLSKGIARQKMVLSGWQSNGYRDGYVEKIKVSKAAGGEDGLKALKDKLAKNNITLFPDVDVQFVYNNALGVTGIDRTTVSRTLVQQLARMYKYNIATYQQSNPVAYVMTPEYTAQSIAKVEELYSSYGFDSVSYRYLAKYNNPDYDDNGVTDRQETSDMFEKALSNTKFANVLSKGGNINIATMLTDVTEFPVYSTRYNRTIEIPFAAMVFSGHVEYCGKAFNLNGNTEKNLLKLIECGAGLTYTVSATQDDYIKKSEFDSYYSIYYNDLKNSMIEDYNELAKALDGVYGHQIVRHDILQNDVVKVTYDNGKYIIINYNEFAVEVDGNSISANSYLKG